MLDPDLIQRSDAWRRVRDVIHATDEQTLRDMADATMIAAPSGAEAERGEWLQARLRETGLESEVDDVGNVVATSPAADVGREPIVLMAHLDTVFAEGTPLAVQRAGDRLSGPGISDNARGLAGMLAVARGLAAADWPNGAPIAFVGSVGEEGAGDLRGAKHYMATRGAPAAAFIALDGAGIDRIVHAGVGSRRLRVTFRGSGGHSWSDWGSPNSIHAAGRAIEALTALPLPAAPRTTLTVGRIGGGTSVNAIPGTAWLEIDLRSVGLAELERLERSVRRVLMEAATAEGGTDGLECRIDVFGDRPAGRTAEDHPLVRLAVAATQAVGGSPELTSSSTDANVAMAAGIPAIAIGAGGDAGGMHTTAEWYVNADGPSGIERAVLVVLGAAGVRTPLAAGRSAAGARPRRGR